MSAKIAQAVVRTAVPINKLRDILQTATAADAAVLTGLPQADVSLVNHVVTKSDALAVPL